MATEGFSLCCNITNKNGVYTADIDYNDTDGVVVSQSNFGEDPEKVMETLLYDVMDELLYQSSLQENEEEEEELDEEVDDYVAKLEAMVEKLQNENESLRLDNDILQRRADDAVNESLNTKKYNDGFNSSKSKDANDVYYDILKHLRRYF